MSRLCLLALILIGVSGLSQVEHDSTSVRATLCELAQHPEMYIGRMVEVRASVAGNDLWIDDFEQKPACPCWMGVIAVLSDQVKPKPDFATVRDDAVKKLFEDMRKGMNVQATFEGRFDALYTWQNKKRVWIDKHGGKREGFGKQSQYGGRIVLRRVSDVLARYVPHK